MEESYCIKEKKFTKSIPNTERCEKTRNNRILRRCVCANCGMNKVQFVGKGFDIHAAIGKLPKPKGGFTPGNYKYMGPYNPLDKQLKYDPNTGKVLEWYVKPKNNLDEISAHHDTCFRFDLVSCVLRNSALVAAMMDD